MSNIGATVHLPTAAMMQKQQHHEKTTTSNNTMTANSEHSSSRVGGELNNHLTKAFLSANNRAHNNKNSFNCNESPFTKSAVCSNDNNSHVVTIQISETAQDQRGGSVTNGYSGQSVAQNLSIPKSKVSIVSFGPPHINGSDGNQRPAKEFSRLVTSIAAQQNNDDNDEETVVATAPTSYCEKTVLLETKAAMLEIGQKPTPAPTTNDLEVNNATYLYYMMMSGQCSPSETLDSGTCSDIEVTPPPLPKKMSPKLKITSNVSAVDGENTSQMMTQNQSQNKVDKNLSISSAEQRKNSLSSCHNRNGSFTDDSDASESSSSLSCDSISFTELNGQPCRRSRASSSLNSISNTNSTSVSNEEDNGDSDATSNQEISLHSTIERRQETPPPPLLPRQSAVVEKVSFLPDSLLNQIRARSKLLNLSEVNLKKVSVEPIEAAQPADAMMTKNLSRVYLNQYTNNSNNHNNHNHFNNHQSNKSGSTSPSELSQSSLTRSGHKSPLANFGIGDYKTFRKSDSPKQYYENDKFYKFHINEHIVDEMDSNVASLIEDESYVGYKEVESGNSTIKSSKGTVRGVKNRVRNGIATFLQMTQTHPNKNYKEKDAGKVVVYTTSMGIVRNTYTQCATIKQILKTLLVKYEERDVFMSGEYQQEVKDRMQCNEINVPQLFVDGKHIGDAECVERLNETGELRKMLKPYKCLESSFTCQTCGGYRLLPCPSCGGSKKSIHRNHFTTEFVALKCMNCDEVGLVKCHNC